MKTDALFCRQQPAVLPRAKQPRFPLLRFQARLLAATLLILGVPVLRAQQQFQRNPPHIGYIYPAGVQRGATCEITVGGQFLEGAKDLLIFNGGGIKASVVKIERPLSQKRASELRESVMQARKKMQESGERPFLGMGMLLGGREAMENSLLKKAGATDDEIRGFMELRKERTDPKYQKNQQISERAIVKIEVAPDAPIGVREVRLVTGLGVSNPLAFCVGQLPELRKTGLLGKTLETAPKVTPPTVLNGQILPGEVDHYAFEAKRGQHMVVSIQARDLIPYLADAVPGWFQPVAVLYDAKGKEVAYAKDYRFSPDPIFRYDVPEDGAYLLEIRDSLYRGREDFVYRITLGEIPFITGIFPLGGRVGQPVVVNVTGWNFKPKKIVFKPLATEGIWTAAELSNGRAIADAPFASDPYPEVFEKEPNNNSKQAQQVKLPVIVNGRIDEPGDVDVFAFNCVAGTKIVCEVQARRLNSPLDSWLKVTDANGHKIAFNDDWEDLSAGLLTHKADSYLTFTAPATGTYFVHLGDSQGQGGPDFAYRLRISPPQPDFALRITPSSLNGRIGFSVPVTIFALRKDGFAGDIRLALKDAPKGFTLEGGVIPAGQDKIRATITLPTDQRETPVSLTVEGTAKVGARTVVRIATPAEDMLQAFAYHHLVPANALIAFAGGMGRGGQPLRADTDTPIQLPAGGSGTILLTAPWSRGGRMFSLHFELSDPPNGITLDSATPNDSGISIAIKTDAAKIKPGASGNLILEAFSEFTPPGQKGSSPATQQKRRFSVGYLPAIPYQVISH